jgi:hypothetical protein
MTRSRVSARSDGEVSLGSHRSRLSVDFLYDISGSIGREVASLPSTASVALNGVTPVLFVRATTGQFVVWLRAFVPPRQLIEPESR